MSIRILLADDHRMVREGLRALLDAQPGLVVVAETEGGRPAILAAERSRPDIVVIDVSMRDPAGIEASRRIVEALPDARVIGLATDADRCLVMDMLRAGASGYLLKDCAFEELARAIHTVAGGKPYLSPAIAGAMVGERMGPGGDPQETASFPALTPREREVLQHVADGEGTREIAARLQVSVKTIESHRRQIMAKLQAQSVAELTKIAIREGLTSI